jgi:hypothetical protein
MVVLTPPVDQPFFTERIDSQLEAKVKLTIFDALSFSFFIHADVPQSARQEGSSSDQKWQTTAISRRAASLDAVHRTTQHFHCLVIVSSSMN